MHTIYGVYCILSSGMYYIPATPYVAHSVKPAYICIILHIKNTIQHITSYNIVYTIYVCMHAYNIHKSCRFVHMSIKIIRRHLLIDQHSSLHHAW